MLCARENFSSEALAGNISLFLDFDGTLVPLADHPDAIEPAPGLAPLLERVGIRLDGRLMLVSGRTIADLDSHLGDHRLALYGSHGMERRLPGKPREDMAEAGDLVALRAAVDEAVDALPPLLIEEKRFGLALHYRQAPEAEGAVLQIAEDMAKRFGMAVKLGKMVAELLPRGFDKGSAVEAAMALSGFAGTTPLFVGDDITDEDGFLAAQRLGGTGILVGDRIGSAATAALPDTGAVLDWLHTLAAEAP
ncbi:trehalose-phosphatase [Parasphingopyxis marina]|uniref:Trehalose 6-phosphate phosphatase n=1 Tax=Parasphingopyxis marina TaxID=2761622 RepID=A0A842HQN2_9SPHN|nr:trehalose-phosphatase [Parasphingopyxis marina]MBC2776048.1 trehalose-phosphatase [Parasphingopyxis marina]